MEALMEISSKRLGIAIVAGVDRKLLGVVTDGDVRRGVQKWGKDFFDMKAEAVMSRNPRSIAEDELAAKALSVMETYSITSLVVAGPDGKAVGIIHLHDILKEGIA
jgi:arabinose-5-phosphate isomerase